MNTTETTAIETSISNLFAMDQEEAALREQLEKLARKKEEAKRTDGDKAKEELQRKIPDARVALLGLLRMAHNLEITLDSEYPTTLRRIVKEAGATGVSLSLVQEVLPDVAKLQAARDELGKNGTDEIIERKAKEHLREGKGRGLFFVWNEETEATSAAVDETDDGVPEDAGTKESPPEPHVTSRSTTKPASTKKA